MTHSMRLIVCAMAALACALASGCSATALLPDAGDVGPSLIERMPEARAISVAAEDGFELRGAVVTAGGSAPVVLHLLPAGASVQTGVPAGVGRVGLASAIESLRDAGLSSVVFDYRGIGASAGRQDVDRFLSDGRAMWHEAVRLAGGRGDRVVIRAGSLGTLLAADLLGRGARPAGVVMVAPVRSTTVVRNAVASQRGEALASLTSWTYRVPEAPDLVDVVADPTVPMLIVLPSEDGYLPEEEARLVARTARSAGHAVVNDPGDHQSAVLRSWNFEIDRDGFGGRRVDALTDDERRFLSRLAWPSEAAGGPAVRDD